MANLKFFIVSHLMLASVHVLNKPDLEIVVDLLVTADWIIWQLAYLTTASLVEDTFTENE